MEIEVDSEEVTSNPSLYIEGMKSRDKEHTIFERTEKALILRDDGSQQQREQE